MGYSNWNWTLSRKLIEIVALKKNNASIKVLSRSTCETYSNFYLCFVVEVSQLLDAEPTMLFYAVPEEKSCFVPIVSPCRHWDPDTCHPRHSHRFYLVGKLFREVVFFAES